MEKELEVKLLGLNTSHFEEKIKSRGGEFLYTEYQENILFENINKNIPDKSYLRIRKSKIGDVETIYFTYKENIENDFLRENNEYTVEVDSSESLIKILSLLDIKEISRGWKTRKKYFYKNVSIEIDTWDEKTYPYPYVEIEVRSEEDLESFLQEFEIGKEHVSLKSISELQ